MKKPYVVAAAGLALVAALAACTSGTDKDADDKYAFGEGDQYVALGDSYTAAPNTGPGDADDGCFRSLTNYPHRVAEATGVRLVDNSCTGASTGSLTQPQVNALGNQPPQLDAIDDETDLVTIRLGANDNGLYGRILQCARAFGPDTDGTPCTQLDTSSGESRVDAELRDLQASLVVGLRSIQERAPEALVLVVGYPQLIPDQGTCVLLPLPAGEYDFARRINVGFNAALEAAAGEVGATYIDMFAASENHDICADDPWIAGIRTTRSGATPWHPYSAEAEAAAELILAELD